MITSSSDTRPAKPPLLSCVFGILDNTTKILQKLFFSQIFWISTYVLGRIFLTLLGGFSCSGALFGRIVGQLLANIAKMVASITVSKTQKSLAEKPTLRWCRWAAAGVSYHPASKTVRSLFKETSVRFPHSLGFPAPPDILKIVGNASRPGVSTIFQTSLPARTAGKLR